MIPRYTVSKIQKIWFAEYKFSLMLKIELLVLEVLSQKGIVPKDAYRRIRRNARFSIKGIEEREKKTHHDIVSFVLEVCSYLGEDARYFHWGLTSNDILDTSLALQLRQSLKIILNDLKELELRVRDKAKKYKYTLCVARTHGVHAEVYYLGLKFALFLDEILRSRSLLLYALKEISVGKLSGAVGTYAHLSPEVESFVLRKLGLRPAPITTQVIPRDRLSILFSAISILGSCLERFALEIRHLQRTEVSEVCEPFYRGQKGSSAMPHKRNPIICERICGLSRVLRGYLVSSLEDISLWHERDISHSSVERVILPDAFNLIDYLILKMIQIVEGLEIDTLRMRKNLRLTHERIFSQGLMLLLAKKGLTRQESYDIVQELSFKSIKKKESLKTLSKRDSRIKKLCSPQELEEVFSPPTYLKHVDTIYKRFNLV